MYSQIAANKRKTFLMFIIFIIMIVGLSWVAGIFITGDTSFTPVITIGFFIGSIIYAIIMYYSGAKLATAVNGAREIQKKDNPRLYRTVENLAITEGMPMPKVYIMDDPAMNAFATGRDPKHAVVCATSGILDALTDSELEGVMAHEMGHVKNYDIRVSMFAFGLVSVISLIADLILHYTFFSRRDNETPPVFYIAGLAAMILAPIAASMIQLAISRRREYLADATGALTTRHPEALASALQKISGNSATGRANSSTAHLFFANPLRGGSIAGLFSTHPPVEKRVEALHEMGRGL